MKQKVKRDARTQINVVNKRAFFSNLTLKISCFKAEINEMYKNDIKWKDENFKTKVWDNENEFMKNSE